MKEEVRDGGRAAAIGVDGAEGDRCFGNLWPPGLDLDGLDLVGAVEPDNRHDQPRRFDDARRSGRAAGQRQRRREDRDQPEAGHVNPV